MTHYASNAWSVLSGYPSLITWEEAVTHVDLDEGLLCRLPSFRENADRLFKEKDKCIKRDSRAGASGDLQDRMLAISNAVDFSEAAVKSYLDAFMHYHVRAKAALRVDRSAELAATICTVLCIHSRSDWLIRPSCARQIATLRPDCEMFWLDGGHDLLLTHATECAAAINRFCDVRVTY